MEGEWSCYGDSQIEKGRMDVIEVACLMEEELSCYRGGPFNGGRMVVTKRPV